MLQKVAHHRAEGLRTIRSDLVTRVVDQGVKTFRDSLRIDAASFGRNNLVASSEQYQGRRLDLLKEVVRLMRHSR